MFQSHIDEPEIGSRVININDGCIHKGSIGIVLSVKSLPGNAGKTCKYLCVNDGDAWESGDMLEKTMDQLEPYTEGGGHA